jgi:2-haloacid dehalogenase
VAEPDAEPGPEAVEAVVFDLGNVLIRWDPHPAIAAEVGAEEATRFLAATDFDFAAWNHQQDAGRPWPEAEAEAVRSHPHWRRHMLAYRTHFARSLRGPIEDTVAILRELHAAGVPLFALTNWSSELFPCARTRFDFLDLFDDIVVSGDEQTAKPAPAIFEVLERRVRRPLSACVLVDDGPANVDAARRVGLDAILFTDTGHLRADLRARGLPV